MCGLCGFTGGGNRETIELMMSAMIYRGPDDAGQWTNGGGLFFGHRRLAIVDPESGSQPMRSKNQELTVVFNGEIYNHRELRDELKRVGYRFETKNSDTEVLLHGYDHWGINFVSRLNGMWAFAIHDRNRNQLFLSRDRFGKKPIFYAIRNSNFIFSSELCSLVKHPQVEKKLNSKALPYYFTHGYMSAPESICEQVQKLPAGHNLIFDLSTQKISIERYWRYEPKTDYGWINRPEKLARILNDKIYQAVKSRIQADVPVGVFLSGGIDSSTIAAFAMTASPEKNIRTYSIGFDEKSFDESSYSTQMAELLGTQHSLKVLSFNDCFSAIDKIFPVLDEPIADSSLVPTYLLSRFASKDVKVALGGDGADELFAGYDPFLALAPARWYSKSIPNSIHRLLTKLTRTIPVSHRNMSLDFKMKKFLSGLGFSESIRNAVWLSCLPPGHISSMFRHSFAAEREQLFDRAQDSWCAPGVKNPIDGTIQFYIENYLENNILTKIDRAGMLNSLEIRAPFLDIELVNLIETIPESLKLKNQKTKYILRRSLSNVVPVEIRNRSKKGFGIPIGKWFQSGDLVINPDALESFVDTKFVRRIYAEHRNGVADWRTFLWAHFVLEQWVNAP